MSDSDTDPGRLLRRARSARGYTLPIHEVLARHDPEVLGQYEALMKGLYLKSRRLSGRTKELLFVVSLIALGASDEHIAAHMKRALREGATSEELLEAIELLIPAAGVARASVGFDVWARSCGVASESDDPSA